jgi:hypothetical protein
MKKQLLELYTDYLMSSFSYTTATGLSVMSDGKISHDKVTRFLSSEDFTPSGLWMLIKPTVREIESASGGEEGLIIIDDTIEEKPIRRGGQMKTKLSVGIMITARANQSKE